MPEINAVFDQRRSEVEGVISAKVISAYELDESQIGALAGALKNELKRDVVIETSVDSSIIGGVIIRAGDTVIDGSVAGKLKDLTSYLTR
jgi:F-type H+-transporting ATPase subunit delta